MPVKLLDGGTVWELGAINGIIMIKRNVYIMLSIQNLLITQIVNSLIYV